MPTIDYSSKKLPTGTSYLQTSQTPTTEQPANGTYFILEILNPLLEALGTDIPALEVGSSKITISSSDPSSTAGTVNDLHLNNSTYDIFQKATETSWNNIGNLKGTDGIDGTDGADGQGIDHVSQTSTSGLDTTYTVWGDSGETVSLGTFTVTDGAAGADGQGIDHISLTGTSGLDDTYPSSVTLRKHR